MKLAEELWQAHYKGQTLLRNDPQQPDDATSEYFIKGGFKFERIKLFGHDNYYYRVWNCYFPFYREVSCNFMLRHMIKHGLSEGLSQRVAGFMQSVKTYKL
jgi:hypothetical protein